MSFAPNTPRLTKGAFVVFSEPFVWHVPNIIFFQYNPETLEQSIEISENDETFGQNGQHKKGNPNAVAGEPRERFFNLKLEIDATDQLEDPLPFHPDTLAFGIGPQLAALELLMYPLPDQLLSNFFSFGAAKKVAERKVPGKKVPETEKKVPESTVPFVLFVWGPSRLLPVRLTSLSIAEEAFDQLLNPIRATVTVSMEVLTEQDYKDVKTPTAAVVRKAYKYTRGLREGMARLNLVNSGEFFVKGLIR
jgi:hypothetical protein